MSPEITFTTYLLAAAIAFGFGAVPVAYTVGRLNGVNVFEVGSRQAGATNVWREVSRKQGFIVTLIDAIKGFTAIMMARQLGLDGVQFLVPVTAAVAGHWNSPFTKFKGGDGVVTMMGSSLAVAPIEVFVSVVIGTTLAISLNRKLAHPSLLGGIFGYISFISLSFRPSSNIDPNIVYGLTGIGLGILLHSMYFHKRHRSYFDDAQAVEDETEPALRHDNIS
ncbi:MAG: glycerol-3-phosphate acyltransferase [Chloroflexi bacterium]|jgi:glycerol-3-phosphate acyltransferase PlsY|nr:glycerol-3-phosphate acyltransferase [Chloroflexota bacterium]MBT3864389.1 glycerol-3-phosphate acyltransferase [Chloroflexota bacterium]MBT4142706.1 glycerol-3-phosphate acyltransferase [Chloroflexota bacterium]MBT4341758.1 glycerol-3-phosphate acyltransferase [Chloroflexota bacterium]MBT5253435.1 glycerol-3-phosphate acyltransferase [Chloroflexota bacterium]